MKIYFAGSITGGRNDAVLYNKIITLLAGYAEVLTEHIGDVQLSDQGQQVVMSAQKIYTTDVNWINESDVLVAEVTQPSLGVGYELAYAEAKNKRVICLYRPELGKRLSAMVAGNDYFQVIEYTDISELKEVFDRLL